MNIKDTIDSRLAAMKTELPEQEILTSALVRKNAQAKRMVLTMGILLFACLSTAVAFSVYAADLIRNNNDFYLRYLDPEEMAVADANMEQHGVKIYFEGLKSEEVREQYFCINKLVESFNDTNVRQQAIEAIRPFLTSEETELINAARFALSILQETYDSPYIIKLSDDKMVFTLFNDYSDYGSYNEIWMIENGIMEKYWSFSIPQMYITGMFPSPDGNKLAVSLGSNKSTYAIILDIANGSVSPELIDSARIMIGQEKGYAVWQRSDYENYSGLIGGIEWTGNDSVQFEASLVYDGGDHEEKAQIRYNYSQKVMNFTYH